MENQEKRPVGRPSDYKPEYCKQVYKLCILGAIDRQIADFFGVCEDTIHNWKKEHPDFFESIKKGKEIADIEVAEALLHRAKGYSHEAVKIFCSKDGFVTREKYVEHYPPDPTSMIFWLKNRQPAIWKDKNIQEQTGPDGGPVQNELTVKFVEVDKTDKE